MRSLKTTLPLRSGRRSAAPRMRPWTGATPASAGAAAACRLRWTRTAIRRAAPTGGAAWRMRTWLTKTTRWVATFLSFYLFLIVGCTL